MFKTQVELARAADDWFHVVSRLRAVSLLLENPRGKVAEHESRASGIRAKRET